MWAAHARPETRVDGGERAERRWLKVLCDVDLLEDLPEYSEVVCQGFAVCCRDTDGRVVSSEHALQPIRDDICVSVRRG